MAAAAEEAEHILKRGPVSAMLKLGFIPSPSSSPLSHSSHQRVPRKSSSTSPSASNTSPASTTTATLFDMITAEDRRGQFLKTGQRRRGRAALEARVSQILLAGAHRACGTGDVQIIIRSADGSFRAKMRAHREILVWRSRFFADQIARLRASGAGWEERGGPVKVEICECGVFDAEAYLEAVALMYCTVDDVRGVVAEESVAEVLALLEVSAALAFDAGVSACLDYLEATAWTEEEEGQAVSVLTKLQPNYLAEAQRVLQRVSSSPASSSSTSSSLLEAAGILPRILTAVERARDDRARRQMKDLVSKLLVADETPGRIVREEAEALYTHCRGCIRSLLLHLSEVAEDPNPDRGPLMADVTRQADTLQWLAGILTARRSAEHLVAMWADQKDLARLHSKTPTVYRTAISEVTARLIVGIGEGTILVPRENKSALLETWLEALYNDFGWMRRGERRRAVEEALGRTVLTLSMEQQHTILLRWAERFLRRGDDCPDIRQAFQVWWRRAFVRTYSGGVGVGDGSWDSGVSQVPTAASGGMRRGDLDANRDSCLALHK